jgi:precorrin-6A/cobalt-precorrin-6A reductase
MGSASDMRRQILILGGTTEARELAQLLAPRTDVAVTLSLAGRTASPTTQAVPVRRGGFGGVEGLAQYLREHAIDALIDATHPYAARISLNAMRAALQTNTPMVRLRRAPWDLVDGDRWTEVRDADQAARSLGSVPRNVFLALGRQEVARFAVAPQHHFVIRSVDPVDPPLAVPHARYILDRGPFVEDKERELLLAHGIEVVVAKNSGGSATYGKIAAARTLGLEVLLLRRPPELENRSATGVGETMAWLDHVVLKPKVDRGV